MFQPLRKCHWSHRVREATWPGPPRRLLGFRELKPLRNRASRGRGRLPTNAHFSVAASTSISKGYTHL